VQAAAEHRGTAFVEIYQNCNIFNDKAFAYMTEKEARDEATLPLEHGKPMLFGKNKSKGIRLNGLQLEVIELGNGLTADDCLVWDETRDDPTMAFITAQLLPPHFPTPIGVFRSVDKPVYEHAVANQIQGEIDRMGEGRLEKLLNSGETWTVHEDGTVS